MSLSGAIPVFPKSVNAYGAECSAYFEPNTFGRQGEWVRVGRPLCKWLDRLRPPVGIFACSDYRARLVLQACGQLGLRVPDDAALLGVNNDAAACEFCDPTLSSVSRSAEQVGFEAASLLDRLMAGKALPEAEVLLAPDGIVRRRSTETVASDDPDVAAAARYMIEHLAEPITVEAIAHWRGVSRRWLEQSFRRILGRSPHVYLIALRVRRACEMLVEQPKLTIEKVAIQCGFSDVKRLRAAFHRFVGASPRFYRDSHCKRAVNRDK